jgi:hypothetical protein
MTDLTRVEFLIEDKNVGMVRRDLLKFKIFNLDVTPVVNAKPRKGGGVEAKSDGSVADMVAASLSERFKNGQIVTSPDVKTILVSLGKSPLTTSQVVNKLVTMKVLRKKPKAKGVFFMINKRKG